MVMYKTKLGDRCRLPYQFISEHSIIFNRLQ
jgi:hypothetical protein